MDQPLILKYRPRDFVDVIGHDEIVTALKRALSTPSHPHAYLFTGPSGIGKTTIARIIARHLEAEVLEIDAASNSSIDQMRELVDLGQYMPITGHARRMIIVDECHSLSKTAWQALLKLLEEPPAHLYLALCTTELPKVPETIQTRCFHVGLRTLRAAEISDLLVAVTNVEGWQVREDVLTAVVAAATGQPRKALSLLQAVYAVESLDEARRIINLIENSEPLIELCQQLVAGRAPWNLVQKVISNLQDDEFEPALQQMAGYMSNVMLRSENENAARRAWSVLDALLFPAQTYSRKAQFCAAVGKVLWAGS